MRIFTAETVPSVAAINARKKTFVAASTFSGCGGSSLGLKMAGFDVRYASEFIASAAATYRLNASKSTRLDTRDIRKTRPEDVLRACGVKKGELDLLDGSPPCSSFSTASAHKGVDNYVKPKRYSDGVWQRVDDLFFEFTRILRGVKPKVFVAENVPGLLNSINRGQFLAIMAEFKKCGYVVDAAVIDASLLGVPQRRKRLIFVGVRSDLARRGFSPVFPRPLASTLTVRDVLPHITAIRVPAESATKDGALVVRRNYVDSTMPSPTITANDGLATDLARLSCGGWVETRKGERRKYTIPELKRVFGYPRDFRIVGKFHQQWERLGRSHAPLQMYYIAATIAEQILTRLGGEDAERTKAISVDGGRSLRTQGGRDAVERPRPVRREVRAARRRRRRT